MAAALYTLPFALIGAADGVVWGVVLLAAALVVLVLAAVRLWSPLVVLGVAVTSCVGFILFFLLSSLDSCGGSTAAGYVEWTGAVAIGAALGIWGVRRGPHAFWTFGVAWVLAGAWVTLVAHVLPGGSGACFD